MREAKPNPLDNNQIVYRLLFINWHCLKTGGAGFVLLGKANKASR
ncbi:hypothetical protein [Bartonella sp. AC130YNZD]